MYEYNEDQTRSIEHASLHTIEISIQWAYEHKNIHNLQETIFFAPRIESRCL